MSEDLFVRDSNLLQKERKSLVEIGRTSHNATYLVQEGLHGSSADGQKRSRPKSWYDFKELGLDFWLVEGGFWREVWGHILHFLSCGRSADGHKLGLSPQIKKSGF